MPEGRDIVRLRRSERERERERETESSPTAPLFPATWATPVACWDSWQEISVRFHLFDACLSLYLDVGYVFDERIACEHEQADGPQAHASHLGISISQVLC